MGIDLEILDKVLDWDPNINKNARNAGLKYWKKTFQDITGEQLPIWSLYEYKVNDMHLFLESAEKFISIDDNSKREDVNDIKYFILLFRECIKHNVSLFT